MDRDLRTAPDQDRPHALVWIDSKEAIIVRWEDEQARIERVVSEIPDHHETGGHLRHDPAIRHGGGRSQDAAESRRNEYQSRFLKDVTHRLPVDADLTVLGPGPTHEHMVRAIRESDLEHHHARDVASRRSSRRTDRQLVALLRELEGDEAPRRTSADAPSHGTAHREAVS